MDSIFRDKLIKFVKSYDIHVFHLYEADKQEIYVNSEYIYTIGSVINKNFILVIIAEHCFVVPKLCALRWKYFEAIINRYSKDFKKINKAIIVDITNIVIDSELLNTVRFTKFGYTFLRFLYENNGYNMFIEKNESDAWKKFLDILIPPKNYWEIKYSFDFTGNTNMDGSGVTIPIINDLTPALPGDFNT
jgi:hypothetical protein